MTSNQNNVSKHLLRLRLLEEASQEEFSKKLNIPLSTYKNIEAGESEPKLTKLAEIASILGIDDFNFFFKPVNQLKYVRFRANSKMKQRSSTLSLVSFWLDDYNNMEKLTGNTVSYLFEKLRRNNLSPIEMANKARELLKLEKHESIRDICSLLEKRAGIKIYTKEFTISDDFFGLSVGKKDGGPAIIVNTGDRISIERQIFSVAHEFGHLLMHLNSYNASIYEENEEEEKEANEFASYFLMPKDVFEDEWNKNTNLSFVDKVLKIKAIFRVSYQVILYRLKEYFPDENLWQIFYSQYKYKNNGKGLKRTDEPESLFEKNQPLSFEGLAILPKRFFFNSRLETLVVEALDDKKITDFEARMVLEISPSKMEEFKACFFNGNKFQRIS
jgi:Zn-dependent peptidase ImmA (M78 family)/DNA-binding XRE family transcriptional regulator